MRLFRKFQDISKEKGFLYALVKTYDYLRFLRHRKKSIVKLNVVQNDITLVIDGFSANLFWQNKPLTTNIGLHSAILNLEIWHDSTQAEWIIKHFENNEIKCDLRLWNLPLTQKWDLKILPDGINWKIGMEIEEILLLEAIRAGLILIPSYTIWLTLRRGGRFPPIKNFEKVDMDKEEDAVLLKEEGIRQIDNINMEKIYLPYFIFKFQSPDKEAELILQNSDSYINGRFVQAAILQEKEYQPGYYDLFDIDIILGYDHKKIVEIFGYAP